MTLDNTPIDDENKEEERLENEFADEGAASLDHDSEAPAPGLNERISGFMQNISVRLRKPKNTIIVVSIIGFALLAILKMIFSSSGERNPYETAASRDADQPAPFEMTDQVSEDADDVPDLQEEADQDDRGVSIPELPELLVNIKPTISDESEGNSDLIDFGALDMSTLKKKKEEEIKQKELEALKAQAKEEAADTPENAFEELLAAEEADSLESVVPKIRKHNPEKALDPIIVNATTNTQVLDKMAQDKAARDKKRRSVSNFIFLDGTQDLESETAPIETKRIDNLSNVIAQGKMVDAVLETAINSEIPGTVRAVVSRNVYGELARNVLIPRGTRLYGNYQSGNATSGFKSRVVITWTRMIRPDGVSVNINSTAVDQFGRTGIAGFVDNKIVETMSSSVLLSLIPLATAVAVASVSGNNNANSTTINSITNTTTITSDPVSLAVQAFTQQISQTTQDIITNLIDTTPTVTLNQGTRVRIIVNQDIKLPTYKSVTKTYSQIT